CKITLGAGRSRAEPPSQPRRICKPQPELVETAEANQPRRSDRAEGSRFDPRTAVSRSRHSKPIRRARLQPSKPNPRFG
uniref:Uncharacterized protein n=1 Tax=Cucumis melo TaxID=3656 RepID=A0A9I9E2Y8_CUCME